MGTFIQADNFSKIAPYFKLFLQGTAVTILLSVFTVIIGFILALILAVMRLSKCCPFAFLGTDKNGRLRDGGFLAALSRFNPLAFLATAYVEILRSTPVLVQVFIIYYGIFGALITLPKFTILGFIKFDRFFPGVVALGMNSGAYLCEIIRSGIQSIDGGQTEAARSLGMTQTQNMRFIILPQAIKNILPALANEFIMVIKDTSLASTFFIGDLMTQCLLIKGTTYLTMEPLIMVAVVYFVLTFILTKLLAVFENGDEGSFVGESQNGLYPVVARYDDKTLIVEIDDIETGA